MPAGASTQVMAYGLRKITNATYQPYGSGRDWFFIGDYEYRNGRRTPDPQQRHMAVKDAVISGKKCRPLEIQQAERLTATTMCRSTSLPPSRCGPPRACPVSEHVARWMRMETGPRTAAEAPSGFYSTADAARHQRGRGRASQGTVRETTNKDIGSLQAPAQHRAACHGQGHVRPLLGQGGPAAGRRPAAVAWGERPAVSTRNECPGVRPHAGVRHLDAAHQQARPLLDARLPSGPAGGQMMSGRVGACEALQLACNRLRTKRSPRSSAAAALGVGSGC